MNHFFKNIGLQTTAWTTAWFAIAGVLLVVTFYPASNNASNVPSSVSPASYKRDQTQPKLISIEQISVGARVHVDISEQQRDQARGRIGTRGWDSSSTAIDEGDWRQIQLSMNGEDGDHFEICLLRPTSWFEASGAAIGKQIQLSIPEQGLDGNALVLAIDECPEVGKGNGRVVTGTFTHIRGGVLSIGITGVEEPIGVTGSHPIFSVDQNDFVYASTLSVGETVQLLSGNASISSIEPIAGEHRVYNLEVRGDHVYHVTPEGLLVHNASEHGSYTVHFSDGTKYHGKGPKSRSEISAKREVNRHNNANPNSPISKKSIDYKKAADRREAFKAEAKRIDDDGGVGSSTNRNRINSPGRKYTIQDGGTIVH